MSLVFGSASSHRVDHGSNANLDNLDPFTIMQWVFLTSSTANRYFWSKGANKFLRVVASGGNADVSFQVVRATTTAVFTTNSTPVQLSTWRCLAVTYDSTASPTGHIYIGSLLSTLVEASYATTTNGSGANTSDAADAFRAGNSAANNAAIQASIAGTQTWNRALSLGELREQQYKPHMTSGNVLLSRYGHTPAASAQPDWSGGANPGTVTGAVLGADVPLMVPWAYSEVELYIPAVAPTSAVPYLLSRPQGLVNAGLVHA